MYVGQPLQCDICAGGHVSRDYPVQGKCRKCLEPGHMARNCTNPPRAWGVVHQGANVEGASSAPTLADAAQASGGKRSSRGLPPSSVSSGVGADLVSGYPLWSDKMNLRDNELSPLFASRAENNGRSTDNVRSN